MSRRALNIETSSFETSFFPPTLCAATQVTTVYSIGTDTGTQKNRKDVTIYSIGTDTGTNRTDTVCV